MAAETDAGAAGVTAPIEGAEKVTSAAQAAQARVRIFTAVSLANSVHQDNALMVKGFKKVIDTNELTIPLRDSTRVARRPADEGVTPAGRAQHQAPI
jgi:hypothetical protein